MEKSKTIHIINLNHYLENNQFAQDLLKHNMEMEPNMEWRIWTEKDSEIQEGLALYTGPVEKSYLPYMSGAYLSHYILYKFGGVYCEMDYEFKIKDFFYKLYQRGEVVLNAPSTYYFLNCNCNQVHYFPYPNHDILKRLLKLLNYNQEPLCMENHLADDAECLSIKRALKLNIFSQEEIDNLIRMALDNNIKNEDVINHFQTQVVSVSSKIVFCLASDYLKLKNIEKFNTDFFENKSINLRVYNDVELSNDQFPKRYDWGYTTVYTSNLELLKAAYEKYLIYNKEKVLLLGKGIRRLFGV